MSETAQANECTAIEVKHVRWEELPVETVNPLFDRQMVVGDQMMVARVIMKKGCVVPLHSHFNEQVTHIESGALHFTINGQEITVRAGEFLCIPPNVPHTAVALEDTIDIDIFTPPRGDWINKTDSYLRGK
ncbi:MAG: cupin domain-containing protein [Acidobacteriaceae bacterium]|nr:cupin domain-containing protein [Acidobacteriaceae bacterium]